MPTRVSACFFAVLLGACVASRAPDSAFFSSLDTIRGLAGVYRNLGEGGRGASPVYLSALIWPQEPDMDHAAVAFIEVSVPAKNTLAVKALRGDGVEKEGLFVEGRDFELRAGRIRLKHELGIAGFRADEPLLGPYYENREIGLDTGGHGRYKQSFGVAGLVFLIVPVAMAGSDEVRFIRVGDAPAR